MPKVPKDWVVLGWFALDQERAHEDEQSNHRREAIRGSLPLEAGEEAPEDEGEEDSSYRRPCGDDTHGEGSMAAEPMINHAESHSRGHGCKYC